MSNLGIHVLRQFCCGNWVRNGIFAFKHYHTSAPRYLYSADYLGIENFKRIRMRNHDKVGGVNVRDKFLARMEEYMESSPQNTIFTDDLKTVIHMAENTEDADMVEKMARRFHVQSGELRFSSFVFGPLVMRMYHILNLPDKALELFRDQALSGFFDQFTSHFVLMDLLFENQRYQDVLDVHTLIRDKLSGFQISIECVTLVMASCLKLDTDASFEAMLEILKQMKEAGAPTSNRIVSYAAFMALKHDQGGVAMEILASRAGTQFSHLPKAYLNVKILTFISLGRIVDAVNLLKSVLLEDQTETEYQRWGNEIFQEVVNQVETAVKDTNDLELNNLIDRVHIGLKQGNHITSQGLEEHIFTTIVRKSQLHDGYKKRHRSSIGGYKSDRVRQAYRPGLRGSGEPIS